MEHDFSRYFAKYEELVATVEQVFARYQKDKPDCVRCGMGCSDCCHALFDLTLIEALYINFQFTRRFSGQVLEALLEKANSADRKIHQIKRVAYKNLRAGKSEEEILSALAEERVRCPLLNDKDLCDLYEYRPITCRLYGLPQAIAGKGYTCAKTGFDKGKTYPTVNLDRIHQRLQVITGELIKDIGSRHIKLLDMLVPLSMALLTHYDEAYLGIDEPGDGNEKTP